MMSSARLLDWGVFACVVVGAMLLDLALFGRSTHRISFREAALRSVWWVVVGLGFTGWIAYSLGTTPSLSYLAAYLVEKSLSVDNLFVFLVIFNYFGIRQVHQQRVLFWGIAGAVVMRGIFIVAGTALLQRFHWMMYLFGAFLVFTGIRLVIRKDDSVDPEKNPALRFARRWLRTTDELTDNRFFTKRNGLWHATPLFLVLLVVEFTDVVFAIDSVPAVLAISTDVFVVYSSNIFAILGLRALYFLLAGMMSRFHYLGWGLAGILVFIGLKMLLVDIYKVPTVASLAVIGGALLLATVGSLLRPAPTPNIPDDS